MVGQNQNWERGGQSWIRFKGLRLKRLGCRNRQLRFWLVAALPVLILRGLK